MFGANDVQTLSVEQFDHSLRQIVDLSRGGSDKRMAKSQSSATISTRLSVSMTESSMKVALPGEANGMIAAADMSDSIATGPVCRKRDAPHIDATITGRNEAYSP